MRQLAENKSPSQFLIGTLWGFFKPASHVPARDNVWTHVPELPDSPAASLCYAPPVTRVPRFATRAFGFRATAPAPPDSSEMPSPLLSLRISHHAYSGVSLSERLRCGGFGYSGRILRKHVGGSPLLQQVAAGRASCRQASAPREAAEMKISKHLGLSIWVGAPCFSRGELDFSPAESALQLKWALALGTFNPMLKAAQRTLAIKAKGEVSAHPHTDR